jgi:hypothetical protein
MGECCLLLLVCMSRFPTTLPALHTGGPAWPVRQSLWYTLSYFVGDLHCLCMAKISEVV